jgi:hypothetical protein
MIPLPKCSKLSLTTSYSSQKETPPTIMKKKISETSKIRGLSYIKFLPVASKRKKNQRNVTPSTKAMSKN